MVFIFMLKMHVHYDADMHVVISLVSKEGPAHSGRCQVMYMYRVLRFRPKKFSVCWCSHWVCCDILLN